MNLSCRVSEESGLESDADVGNERFSVPGSILPMTEFLSPRTMRWPFASHNVCFTNAVHASFFAAGNGVPIIRGWGVYQVRGGGMWRRNMGRVGFRLEMGGGCVD